MPESSPSGRRRDENVPPLPGIAGCRRRADVAAGATVPVTAQRPDPTRPDPCGRSQDRHPVLHLPADPAALINLSRAAVALIVIVSADRAASSSRPTIASSRALSIATPWLLPQCGCPTPGEGLTGARTLPRLASCVHSGVIVDQWDALVAELATTPDVVDRLLAEHVPDDSRRCRACTRPGL